MKWRLALVLLIIALDAPAPGAPTVLDFEDLAESTVVRMQYAAQGVVVATSAIIASPGQALLAHSGKRVLSSLTAEFATPQPLTLSFTSGQHRVTFFAGVFRGGAQLSYTGVLRAFDAAGHLLAQDGPKPVIAGVCTTSFSVVVPSPIITRITFVAETPRGPVDAVIDDLSLEGATPPPVSSIIPQVKLISPSNGQQFDAVTLQVKGNVTGQALPTTADVRVTAHQPGTSHLPPLVKTVPLTGPAGARAFDVSVAAPVGLLDISVEVIDTRGVSAQASASVVNIPSVIQQRRVALGGDAQLGSVQWGLTGDGCRPQQQRPRRTGMGHPRAWDTSRHDEWSR